MRVVSRVSVAVAVAVAAAVSVPRTMTQIAPSHPTVSLAIALIFIVGTWSLLRDSVNLALHAVPTHIDFNKVDACLRELPGVTDVHDLHIWAISTTDVALTAHLVYPTGDDHDELLRSACDTLTNRFGIGHATLQVERGPDAHACPFTSGNLI